MYYRDEEIIKKMGLKAPQQHKYLSYVSKPLDLILFSDNLEALKAFQEKYKESDPEKTLRACIEYGASSCFTHFFENTRSPDFFFENLFKKPENPILGTQCAFYFVRNNNMLETINEVCEKIFPGKTSLDLLKNQEQIEYCAVRFGVKGRVKLAQQLLDKLPNPIYMVNNMHVFEYAYTNKAAAFCNIYLTKLEEKGLIEPFLLSLFSKTEIGNQKKHANFFDRFTKEIYNQDNLVHHVLNEFLIRNIQKGSINPEFQELMMAYCIFNDNAEGFKAYNDARPLNKQNIISTIKEPWKFSSIQHEPYSYIKDRNTFGINMTNNALKLFSEPCIDRWVAATKELGVPEVKDSIASLFCLGNRYNFASAIKILGKHIDWESQDLNGNNFAHYLANFFEKFDKSMQTSIPYKEMLSFFGRLIENSPLPFGVRNNDGITAGEIFVKTFKTSKSLESSSYTKDHRKKNLEELSKLEKALNYAVLNHDLSCKETTTKRMKI